MPGCGFLILLFLLWYVLVKSFGIHFGKVSGVQTWNQRKRIQIEMQQFPNFLPFMTVYIHCFDITYYHLPCMSIIILWSLLWVAPVCVLLSLLFDWHLWSSLVHSSSPLVSLLGSQKNGRTLLQNDEVTLLKLAIYFCVPNISWTLLGFCGLGEVDSRMAVGKIIRAASCNMQNLPFSFNTWGADPLRFCCTSSSHQHSK